MTDSIDVIAKRLETVENLTENLHHRVGGTPAKDGLEDTAFRHDSRISDLEKWREFWRPKLEGNGKRPLLQRVDDLEAFVSSMKFWGQTIAVLLTAQIIGAIGAVIWTLLKLIPMLERLTAP